VVGKYTGLKDAYKSLIEALHHGGLANGVSRRAATGSRPEAFENGQATSGSRTPPGVLVPGGFGARGAEARSARSVSPASAKCPFFGVCFGMQMAVIEAARTAGIEEASSTSSGPRPSQWSGLLTEWVRGNQLETRSEATEKGGTMRLGAYDAVLAPGIEDRRGLRAPRLSRSATGTATR
jgi:CTP synthase